MSNYAELEQSLTAALSLTRRPIAISMHDAAPSGVPAFSGTVPSGCSFWRIAAEGRTVATSPGDHYNCPIGSHTHNIALPESRQSELMDTLQLMTGIGYLKMEEVPGIPQLAKTPGSVVYSPLGDAPTAPDAVLIACKPANMMLLIEAATRAGAGSAMPTLARPTCMAIPAALRGGGMITSTGCIGNRVYTQLGDDEIYAVFRGEDLPRIMAELATITHANAQLKTYHEARKLQLTVL
jgi:uncharacterized protein (DUF169 family)